MSKKEHGSTDVYWKNKKTEALGRNGWMQRIGINIFAYNVHASDGRVEEIEITPINSKDNGGRCHIRIPISELLGVIEELEKIARREKFFDSAMV